MEKQVTVTHPEGLHARPAATFVRAAARYSCSIDVLFRGQSANAKSILSILRLGVSSGEAVVLRAEGEGAAEALEELSALLAAAE